MLQLLRERPLLVEIITLAISPLLHHLITTRRLDTLNIRKINPYPMQPIPQHRLWLTTMHIQKLRIQQLFPTEIRIRLSPPQR